MVIDTLPPVGRAVATQERHEAAPLHVSGDGHASSREEGRCEVEILHEMVIDRAGGRDPGPANDQRHPERFLIHPAFVEPAVFAQEEPLVARIDHDRILGEPRFVQVFEHAADGAIDPGDATKVVGDIPLVVPPREGVTRQIGLLERLVFGGVSRLPAGLLLRRHVLRRHQGEILGQHVPGDRHLLFGCSAGAAGIVVEECFRLGEGRATEEVEFLRPRLPFAMRCLVLEHEHERLGGIPLCVEPVERQVGDDVGHVAWDRSLRGRPLHRFWCRQHCRVVVGALAWQHFPVIESGRFADQVPLPNDCRLITRLLQKLWERRLPAVEGAVIVTKAIAVAVFAGEDHRPRGAADGVGAETVLEQRALAGKPVDVRRFDQLRAVGRDGGRGMVVGKDEQDVRAGGGLRARGDVGGPCRRPAHKHCEQQPQQHAVDWLQSLG